MPGGDGSPNGPNRRCSNRITKSSHFGMSRVLSCADGNPRKGDPFRGATTPA
jgi:hypothetical protein